MTRIVAVTGANGYVGQFVVRRLLQEGVQVRALGEDRGYFTEPVQWIAGRLGDEDAITALVNGADAVIHLAYAHVPGRYRGGEGDDLGAWMQANVQGSLDLLLKARDASVRQFVFLSSRAVFSHTEPERLLDESHPVSPNTHYGAYKVAVEAFLRSFASVEGMKTTSIRATGIYGVVAPIERTKWWHYVQAVLNGEPVTTVRGGTEVHGDDVGRVIWQVLNHQETAYDVIHMSDLYLTTHEIVRLICECARRKNCELPPVPDTPASNVLVCRRLEEMGIQLGGETLLRQTIQRLVDLAT